MKLDIDSMEMSDGMKRRLKEFEKIKKTGTSTEFDRGYKKALKDMLNIHLIFDTNCKCCKANKESIKINSRRFKKLIFKKIKKK